MDNINALLGQYGYIVLFVMLMLELIAFPIPGEALMTYCGFLVFQNKLNFEISIIIAFLGVSTGITFSYWIGKRLGYPFFRKYGFYIHLTPQKLERNSLWFDRYGNFLLMIAYFVPGLRHITGYLSGISRIRFQKFAMFSYTGAFIWTATFITLGRLLGSKWAVFHNEAKKYLIILGIIAAVLTTLAFLVKYKRARLQRIAFKLLNDALNVFNSLGKIKIAIAGIALAFLIFCSLSISLVKNFFENDFVEIDRILTYVTKIVFDNKWNRIMDIFSGFLYPAMAAIALALTSGIIAWKGKNKLLEFESLLFSIIGGEVLVMVLNIFFDKFGPRASSLTGYASSYFPSERAFISVVLYGFALFFIIRHINRRLANITASVTAFIMLLFTGISQIFLNLELPSNVIGGYAIGLVWLFLNIIILEIYRIVPDLKQGNKNSFKR